MNLSYNSCVLLRDICYKLNMLKKNIQPRYKINAADEFYYNYEYYEVSLNSSNNCNVVYITKSNNTIFRFDNSNYEYCRIRDTTKDKIIVSNSKDKNIYKVHDKGYYTVPDMPLDEDQFDSIRFQMSLLTDEDKHLDAIMLASFLRTVGLEGDDLIDVHLTPLYDCDMITHIHSKIDQMCESIREQFID